MEKGARLVVDPVGLCPDLVPGRRGGPRPVEVVPHRSDEEQLLARQLLRLGVGPHLGRHLALAAAGAAGLAPVPEDEEVVVAPLPGSGDVEGVGRLVVVHVLRDRGHRRIHAGRACSCSACLRGKPSIGVIGRVQRAGAVNRMGIAISKMFDSLAPLLGVGAETTGAPPLDLGAETSTVAGSRSLAAFVIPLVIPRGVAGLALLFLARFRRVGAFAVICSAVAGICLCSPLAAHAASHVASSPLLVAIAGLVTAVIASSGAVRTLSVLVVAAATAAGAVDGASIPLAIADVFLASAVAVVATTAVAGRQLLVIATEAAAAAAGTAVGRIPCVTAAMATTSTG
mmetsp:Transcript_119471/g.283604  ORF Transcript_119471/g.283604 Transcript_119471/m.283604 type:complete len:342 (+) Transcript_119471:794-1819(+)